MGRKCAVPRCFTQDGCGKSLFLLTENLPAPTKDRIISELSIPIKRAKHLYACELHFKKRSIKKRGNCLSLVAEPETVLPGEDRGEDPVPKVQKPKNEMPRKMQFKMQLEKDLKKEQSGKHLGLQQTEDSTENQNICSIATSFVCRVCLAKGETIYLELFSKDGGNKIAKELIFFSGIEVHANDGLPQKICLKCYQSVLKACELKETCIKSDQHLRQRQSDELVTIKVEETEEDLGRVSEIHYVDSSDWNMLDDGSVKLEPELEDYRYASQPVSPLRSSQPQEAGTRSPADFISDDLGLLETETQEAQKEKFGLKPENLRCFICNKIFNKVIDRKIHVREDHADDLTCRVCNQKKLSSKGTENCLRFHELGHDYLCQICAKTFLQQSFLNTHYKAVHELKKTFLCDLCGIKLNNIKNLSRHMKAVHLKLRDFACPYTETCHDVSYSRKNALNLHLYRVHKVPAPLKCPKCYVGLPTPGDVRAHLKYCSGATAKPRIVTDLREFRKTLKNGTVICTVCSKVFGTKLQWDWHYQCYHKDNKTCKICDKKFGNVSNYRKHLNAIHKKIKKYHCDVEGCNKSVSSRQSLKNHKNTHTGEKPYACDLCDFKSGDSSTRDKHKKKAHPKMTQKKMQQTMD